jgi:putative ABC transport system ATP-binding protein
MLSVRGLRYAWPGVAGDVVALDALDLAAGATLFVHGPSGSGKSTLLGLLAGVLVPREGTITLAGRAWGALSPAARDRHRADHVGVLFQQFNLLPYLPVLDNVRLALRFSPRRRARAAAGAAEALLDRMALPRDTWGRPAGTLSVGQQQRVAAARALVGQPEVVIADEPTSALDAAARDGFMDLLLGQCRDAGSTLVFVSHDERLAARFAQRLAIAAPA